MCRGNGKAPVEFRWIRGRVCAALAVTALRLEGVVVRVAAVTLEHVELAMEMRRETRVADKLGGLHPPVVSAASGPPSMHW